MEKRVGTHTNKLSSVSRCVKPNVQSDFLRSRSFARTGGRAKQTSNLLKCVLTIRRQLLHRAFYAIKVKWTSLEMDRWSSDRIILREREEWGGLKDGWPYG